jgi:hypothetical protein
MQHAMTRFFTAGYVKRRARSFFLNREVSQSFTKFFLCPTSCNFVVNFFEPRSYTFLNHEVSQSFTKFHEVFLCPTSCNFAVNFFEPRNYTKFFVSDFRASARFFRMAGF